MQLHLGLLIHELVQVLFCPKQIPYMILQMPLSSTEAEVKLNLCEYFFHPVYPNTRILLLSTSGSILHSVLEQIKDKDRLIK